MASSSAAKKERIHKAAASLLLQRGPTFQRTKTQLLDQKIDDAAESQKQLKQQELQNEDIHATFEIKTETLDSSDEYDTDLELEERVLTPFDRYGAVKYKRNCKQLGIIPIGTVIRGLKSPWFDISGRGLQNQDVLLICRAVIENPVVTTLHLNANELGPSEVQYVACVLEENINVKSLSLANNQIGHNGVKYLTDVLLDNSILTRLDISGNHLQDAEAECFSSVLKVNSTLTYLNLSHNNFGDEAAKVLGPAIGANESLRVLDLSWNQLRPVGGMHICVGIQENVVLTSLNLAYNGLSTAGAKAMAEALQMNDVLTDLDLTCNRIFDEGAVTIGKALLINESLKKLKLANNPMTTASAVTLLSVLKQNEYTSLELLDMSSIHLYKDALNLIKEIQEQHTSFDFIYGGIVNSDDQFGQGADFSINNRNPLSILKEFMASRSFRLVDLFKQLDKDGSGSVSKDEFIHGLQVLEVPLTRNQLDRLIKMLDKDGDGEVDYQELVTGDKEHRRKQRAKMGAVLKMQALSKRKSTKEPDKNK